MSTNENLYVVTVLFNPFNYQSHRTKFDNFAPYIKWSGATLITVEIAFDGRPFEHTSPDNPDDLQLRTDNVLWHKERGLNLGIQLIERRYPDANDIAWSDDDIRFTNPNWVNDIRLALHHYCIIQPFSQACNLDPKYQSMWICDGRMKFYEEKKGFKQIPAKEMTYTAGGHPGLAWAARRETIDQIGGLLDFGVTGSGTRTWPTHLWGILYSIVNQECPPE